MHATAREWVGGRLAFPGYVLEGGPFRPALMLWVEIPEGCVLRADIADPRETMSFAETLRAAMAQPLVGAPRRPQRVRVGDLALAAELRGAHPDLEVVVAPTPELDEVLESMAEAVSADEKDESYLAGGRIPAEAVARLFDAARLLWSVAPWKLADDDHVLRVDVPAFGVEGACLSIIGALGESLGFLLFPSLAGYEAFLRFAEQPRPRADFGTTVLSLEFWRRAELPPAMRAEVKQHGWRVAAPEAYPRVEHRDPDAIRRPLSERDVRLVTAIATSLGAFFGKHGGVAHREEFEPICESWYDNDDLEVRFTLPYEAFAMFSIETPPRPRQVAPAPRPGRNAPCPCGSGRKYKKCCLAKDEAAAEGFGVGAQSAADDADSGQARRADAAGRAPVHAIDERLVAEMRGWAARRFGAAWRRSERDFADPENALQLASPWSVYGFQVEGRTIADWFLQIPSRRLAPEERAWLEAQGRAWMGVWEVTAVDPGRSVTVEDLLSGESRVVQEVSGSRTLVARDTVLGRVVDHDGVAVFCGIHPRPLPPLEAADVVRLARGKLRCKGDVPVERLRDDPFGRYLIARWERAVADLDRRRRIPPTLHNTDGDALLLTSDHFAFDPARRADVVARLATIEGVAPADEDEEPDSFTFLRPGNAMHASWETTIIGTARVGAATLAIESNSLRRADDLRRRVEGACGALVRHRAREHADPRALMKQAAAPPPARTSAPPPEADALLRAYKERHYADWPDHSLPALGGKTPRAAVRTKSGRTQVEVLLKDMENHEALLPAGERFDFSEIRVALGLSPP